MVIINWMCLRVWDQKIIYKSVNYHHLRNLFFVFWNGWVQILEKNFKPGPCVCCHILRVDGHSQAFSLQLNRMLYACTAIKAIKKSLVQYSHPRLGTWHLGGKWKEKKSNTKLFGTENRTHGVQLRSLWLRLNLTLPAVSINFGILVVQDK